MNQIKWKKNKIKSTKKWMRLWQDFQRKECKRFEAKIYKDKKDELPQNNIITELSLLKVQYGTFL